MRRLAIIMLVLAFAFVRPLAGQAEGLGPCMEPVAAADAVDMPCHEMMAQHPQAPDKPAKAAHAACASACCASPALVAEASAEPVMARQPVLLAAAASPAANPVPHAPDLRPPIVPFGVGARSSGETAYTFA
jgi:hypothetical protein